MDIRHTFDYRWADPSNRLHVLLGRSGYKLPARRNLEWVEIGSDNWVLVHPSPHWDHGRTFKIDPDASGNIIVFSEKCTAIGTVYLRGSGNIAIIVGPDHGTTPLHLHFHANEQLFFWGKGATSNTSTFEMAYDRTNVLVGEWCMFSASIIVRTGDEHAIFDVMSGRMVNPGKDVIFEPHVWVGYGASVMKGVTVGFGSIIGAHSVVTDNVPRKSVVAGVPAKVIRQNVSWTRQRAASNDAVVNLRAYEETLADTLAITPLSPL
jgi:acetyltransferase-like isoleucine patch superfamily enzyme